MLTPLCTEVTNLGCAVEVENQFSLITLHISLHLLSLQSALFIGVAKGFYGTTENSVAKVSRMRTDSAELAHMTIMMGNINCK